MKCRTETFRSRASSRSSGGCAAPCTARCRPPRAAPRGRAATRPGSTRWTRSSGSPSSTRPTPSSRPAARSNKVSWNENTMLADDQGNIAWYHPGRLPIRPKRWDERLPLPGTGNAEWRGFLRPSQRPHVINPDQGWLANWNNMPSVGWTVGDAPRHRAHQRPAAPRRLPEPARGRGGGRAELRRDQGRRPRGRHDGAAAPAARRPAARGGGRGDRAAPRPCSTRSWPGTATTTAPTPRAPSTPAWRRGRRSRTRPSTLLPGAVDDWLGGRRPLTRVRLRRRRRRGVPELTAGRAAAGGGERRDRARRPGHLASAAPDVRRHRARRRAEARFEVL